MSPPIVTLDELEGPRLIRREELVAANRMEWLRFERAIPLVDPAALLAGYREAPRGGSYVLAHGGVPVSQVKLFHSRVRIHGSLLRTASIGDVCTQPDYQGVGAATRLLHHGFAQLRREGARLVVISGERGLYTRLGCTQAGRYAQAMLQPGMLGPAFRPVSVRPSMESDAGLFARLYATEPVGFQRGVEYIAGHLGNPRVYWHAENWIVEAAGKPVGYLLLGVPWEYRQDPSVGIRELMEYAGDRTAIAAALGEVFAHNIGRLRLVIPWQDADLIVLLEEMGVHFDYSTLPDHTMRIIDLPGLMADLRAYAAARLPRVLRRGLRFEQTGSLLGSEGDDRYVIARGAERLEMDGAAMTRLVLGDSSEPASLSGVVGEAASLLFPLPSFLPGINFR
jgi:ribosomal protein S18 acetylase RimI-like enzyme